MKIALVGDVMLGRLVNENLKQKDPSDPWGDTLTIFQDADLAVCNLECVLSNRGNPWSATPKMFHFRSDEKNVHSLLAANIHLVSLANNHVLDYEDEGLLRMLEVLNQQKIAHAGAGKNLSQATQPAICKLKDGTVGLIAFTDNEPNWEAQQNKPGIFYVPTEISDHRAQNLLREIKKLRQEVDFVILSAHWGSNWGYDVPRVQKLFAHALIDAGADLVFGHSGHVFRGIEIYKNRPVIYCAGDFIDDYAVDEIEKNDESFLFIIEKKLHQKMKLFLYPTLIEGFQANLVVSDRRESILSKMQNLCEDLGTHLQCFSDHAVLEI